MGFHFRKSIKLGKLFKFTKNKNSSSLSVGGKKVKVTMNTKGKATVSLPGTGISYDTNLGKKKSGKK